MTRPHPHENRGLTPLTPSDILWIGLSMFVGLVGAAVIGFHAVRTDRPAVCDPYPTYAECSAVLAEGR